MDRGGWARKDTNNGQLTRPKKTTAMRRDLYLPPHRKKSSNSNNNNTCRGKKKKKKKTKRKSEGGKGEAARLVVKVRVKVKEKRSKSSRWRESEHPLRPSYGMATKGSMHEIAYARQKGTWVQAHAWPNKPTKKMHPSDH